MTCPSQSQQNNCPQSQHLQAAQVTSCGLLCSEESAVSSSCLVNLPLICRRSALTHSLLHCSKSVTLWRRFSPAVHSEQLTLTEVAQIHHRRRHQYLPIPPPTLLACSFFSEALRISGQLPATVWRRIGG